MKRFLAFCSEYYDTAGGVFDFVGDFDTIDDAKAKLDGRRCGDQVHQILDVKTGLVCSRDVGSRGTSRKWDPEWKINEVITGYEV